MPIISKWVCGGCLNKLNVPQLSVKGNLDNSLWQLLSTVKLRMSG